MIYTGTEALGIRLLRTKEKRAREREDQYINDARLRPTNRAGKQRARDIVFLSLIIYPILIRAERLSSTPGYCRKWAIPLDSYEVSSLRETLVVAQGHCPLQ